MTNFDCCTDNAIPTSQARLAPRGGCLGVPGNNHPSKHEALNNAISMLGQRRRRWPNIKMALVQCLEFSGITFSVCTMCLSADRSMTEILTLSKVDSRTERVKYFFNGHRPLA